MRATYEETRKRNREEISLDPIRGDDPWLRRTGWPELLKGYNRLALLRLIDTKTPTLPYESRLLEVISSLLYQAETITGQSNLFVRMIILQVDPHTPRETPIRTY
jgi:hypothetical protein